MFSLLLITFIAVSITYMLCTISAERKEKLKSKYDDKWILFALILSPVFFSRAMLQILVAKLDEEDEDKEEI